MFGNSKRNLGDYYPYYAMPKMQENGTIRWVVINLNKNLELQMTNPKAKEFSSSVEANEFAKLVKEGSESLPEAEILLG